MFLAEKTSWWLGGKKLAWERRWAHKKPPEQQLYVSSPLKFMEQRLDDLISERRLILQYLDVGDLSRIVAACPPKLRSDLARQGVFQEAMARSVSMIQQDIVDGRKWMGDIDKRLQEMRHPKPPPPSPVKTEMECHVEALLEIMEVFCEFDPDLGSTCDQAKDTEMENDIAHLFFDLFCPKDMAKKLREVMVASKSSSQHQDVKGIAAPPPSHKQIIQRYAYGSRFLGDRGPSEERYEWSNLSLVVYPAWETSGAYIPLCHSDVNVALYVTYRLHSYRACALWKNLLVDEEFVESLRNSDAPTRKDIQDAIMCLRSFTYDGDSCEFELCHHAELLVLLFNKLCHDNEDDDTDLAGRLFAWIGNRAQTREEHWQILCLFETVIVTL